MTGRQTSFDGAPPSIFGVLVRVLLQRWRFVIVVALICASLALAWRLITPRIYRASVLVSVVDEKDSLSGGLSALVGQLGPLASLAGGLGGGSNDARAIAMLESRALARQYIQSENLMPILFADKWDASEKRWQANLSRVPTLWDGVKKFSGLRRVAQDSKTRLVTVTVDWKDAKLATQWCNDLIRLTNQILRERELIEARKNIQYLAGQALSVNRIEVQNAVSALIQREMKREMLANGAKDFALTVIDPAVMPERPSPPGIVTSVAIGTMAGVLLAIFALMMRISMDIRRSDGVS
jgi:uncharacterized protein involved in exopolysaccharide biosynthesis